MKILAKSKEAKEMCKGIKAMTDFKDGGRKNMEMKNICEIYTISINDNDFYSFTMLLCDYICKTLPCYLKHYEFEEMPIKDLIFKLVKELMKIAHTDYGTQYHILKNLKVERVESNDCSDAKFYIEINNDNVKFIQGW